MAERMLRRGLPRVAGGDPWPGMLAVPGEDTVVVVAAAAAAEVSVVAVDIAQEPVVLMPVEPEPVAEALAVAEETSAAVALSAASAGTIRRGLPRTEGGEPWPAAGTAAQSVEARVAAESVPATAVEPKKTGASVASEAALVSEAATEVAAQAKRAASLDTAGAVGLLRRGLPRVEGGEPWPAEGTPARTVTSVAPAATVTPAASGAPQGPVAPLVEQAPRVEAPVAPSPAVAIAAQTLDVSAPLPFQRTVWQGRAPRHAREPEPVASKLRPTWPQAIGGLMGAAALGLIAGAGIALVRALLSMTFMQDFLAAFPGEYHLPEGSQPGFPAWIGWQHFFNMFLMILIIRSGLQVRTEKRPTMFWAPRRNPKGKISLALWFHQSLDILWLVNGVIFVVLLFVSGHWVRIVPTSWEVFPNALSAVLQYISFDWPTENGWVNYNSVQQLAYFTTVFIAAPLAAITGFRMSSLWPKKAERLSKMYPVEWARALHFPIMLYFIAFIFVHVMLVVLTGFLRNLNHMYASQDAVTWTGFWVFAASVVVIIGAWVAARPLVLAPIAKTFGNVSGR